MASAISEGDLTVTLAGDQTTITILITDFTEISVDSAYNIDLDMTVIPEPDGSLPDFTDTT